MKDKSKTVLTILKHYRLLFFHSYIQTFIHPSICTYIYASIHIYKHTQSLPSENRRHEIKWSQIYLYCRLFGKLQEQQEEHRSMFQQQRVIVPGLMDGEKLKEFRICCSSLVVHMGHRKGNIVLLRHYSRNLSWCDKSACMNLYQVFNPPYPASLLWNDLTRSITALRID